MAQQGGGPPRQRSTAGKSGAAWSKQAQRLAPFLASFIALNSAQQQRRYDPEISDVMGGDTQLSDDSLSATGGQRASVLDAGAPTRSYTQSQVPDLEAPIAGGGHVASTTAEMQRMQYQAQRMQEIQSQFVGESGAQPTRTTEQFSPQEEMENEEASPPEVEDQGADDFTRAAQNQAQTSRNLATQKAKARANKQASDAEEKQMRLKMKRAESAATRLTTEGTEFATAETLVPLLILIVQMNCQMVSKHFFLPLIQGAFGDDVENTLQGAPFFDQSDIEDIITLMADCLFSVCNPCCTPIILTAIITGVIVQKFGSAGSALKTVVGAVVGQ